jgi:ribosomal protein S18 acetylase RimI-like enzyme
VVARCDDDGVVNEADLENLLRYWRAYDALFAEVEPTWWGAVVRDRRYAALHEVNYARVETDSPVDLTELDRVLLEDGIRRAHVVTFRPEWQTELLVQASSRGDQIGWDLVMVSDGPGDDSDPRIEESELKEGFWSVYRRSLEWFSITGDDVATQLREVERDVLAPSGRRWFVGRERGAIVALAALLVLDGVGFIDHVTTDPSVRRRGFATALTRRAVSEARRAGAEQTFLLAEPAGAGAAVYMRIGFRTVTQIASWTSPPR